MTLHHQTERLNPGREEEESPISRRTILRRSAAGITGLVLAPLLVACGDEEEDPEEAVDEINDPPDDPDVDPDDPGFDAPNDDIEDDTPDADEDGED